MKNETFEIENVEADQKKRADRWMRLMLFASLAITMGAVIASYIVGK